jgi:hypothetical protein
VVEIREADSVRVMVVWLDVKLCCLINFICFVVKSTQFVAKGCHGVHCEQSCGNRQNCRDSSLPIIYCMDLSLCCSKSTGEVDNMGLCCIQTAAAAYTCRQIIKTSSSENGFRLLDV